MHLALVVVISLLTQGIHLGLKSTASGEGRLCIRLSTLAGVPIGDVCVDYRSLARIGAAVAR